MKCHDNCPSNTRVWFYQPISLNQVSLGVDVNDLKINSTKIHIFVRMNDIKFITNLDLGSLLRSIF